MDGGGSITLAEDVMFQYRSTAWMDDRTILEVIVAREIGNSTTSLRAACVFS